MKMNLKLLYDVKIIPSPYEFLCYEIYDMGQDIGFKVGPRCFILSADECFKVVSEDEFNKRKCGIVEAPGNILFKKAVQIMGESTGNPIISASNRLVLELNSIFWRFYFHILIFWNCLLWIAQWVISPNSPSSAMLLSGKMPNDKKFLDNFNEKCDILCQCGVIPDRQKEVCYKITYIIAEERRHAFIVIRGETHSFVLELSNRKFEKKFYNCPSIRYIPDTEIFKQFRDSDSITKSADDFIRLAIETVSKMDKYDVLKNNCQNFVKNFLHELKSSIEPQILEGEVATSWIDKFVTQDHFHFIKLCVYFYFLVNVSNIFEEIPSYWWPYINASVVVILFVLFLYCLFSPIRLFPIVWILNLLYIQSNNVVFYTFCLVLLLVTIRLLRLPPFHIFLLFLISSLLVAFAAYFFYSDPIFSSIALVLYAVSFGGWSALGRAYHQNLTIILPNAVFLIIFSFLNYLIPWLHTLKSFSQFSTFTLIIISYCIQNFLIPCGNFEILSLPFLPISVMIISILIFYYSLSWEYLLILLSPIFWKREFKYESIFESILLVATPFIGRFCIQNLDRLTIETLFISSILLIIVSILKNIFIYFWKRKAGCDFIGK